VEDTEALTGPSKEVCLVVKAEITKNVMMSSHQKAKKNRNINIAKKSYENVANFMYLGTTVTNQNSINEKITCRLKSVVFAAIQFGTCLLVCCLKT
jgi:hypothetical protein